MLAAPIQRSRPKCHCPFSRGCFADLLQCSMCFLVACGIHGSKVPALTISAPNLSLHPRRKRCRIRAPKVDNAKCKRATQLQRSSGFSCLVSAGALAEQSNSSWLTQRCLLENATSRDLSAQRCAETRLVFTSLRSPEMVEHQTACGRQLTRVTHHDLEFSSGPFVAEADRSKAHPRTDDVECPIRNQADTHVRLHHPAHRVETGHVNAQPHRLAACVAAYCDLR